MITTILFDHFTLNRDLLEYIEKLKPKYILHLFTTDIIQNDKAVKKFLDPLFLRIFTAKELGFSKKHIASYHAIVQNLRVAPSEILFVDDTKENIAAASQAGLETLHFISNHKLFTDLKKLLLHEYPFQ